MGGKQAVIAIGVGCRKGCPADEIVTLVREALATLTEETKPRGMFSIAEKRDEPGLAAAAVILDLPLSVFEADALRAYAADATHASDRVMALHGLPSVAETAALAGAGEGATLLVARRASAQATCAIAGCLLTRSAP